MALVKVVAVMVLVLMLLLMMMLLAVIVAAAVAEQIWIFQVVIILAHGPVYGLSRFGTVRLSLAFVLRL